MPGSASSVCSNTCCQTLNKKWDSVRSKKQVICFLSQESGRAKKEKLPIECVVNSCVCLQVISTDKSRNHIFRLTGPGADQDPKGLFTIDMETGDVSVSRSLDREAIDSYQVRVLVCSTTVVSNTCFSVFLPGSSHLFYCFLSLSVYSVYSSLTITPFSIWLLMRITCLDLIY